MITEQDLLEAIAECQGDRHPNANTCIKLAAYYTIRNELFGSREQPTFEQLPIYSTAGPVDQTEILVDYNSDTEFAQAINGMNADRAWAVMDELMDAVRITNPRLYAGVMRRMEEG